MIILMQFAHKLKQHLRMWKAPNDRSSSTLKSIYLADKHNFLSVLVY